MPTLYQRSPRGPSCTRDLEGIRHVRSGLHELQAAEALLLSDALSVELVLVGFAEPEGLEVAADSGVVLGAAHGRSETNLQVKVIAYCSQMYAPQRIVALNVSDLDLPPPRFQGRTLEDSHGPSIARVTRFEVDLWDMGNYNEILLGPDYQSLVHTYDVVPSASRILRVGSRTRSLRTGC